MKVHIIILALLISASGLTAQEHDAVFKLLKKEYTLNPDESITFTYTKELKLNTTYAFNRMYGETFVKYNPDYQKLDIEYAYTIMADGKRVDSPKNAFNEVLPKEAAAYPAYNSMREMVITHTALEPGCTIYLKYKITSHAKYITELMGTEVLQEEVPVEKAEVLLSVPARRGLQYKLLNSSVEPKQSYQGDLRTYSFSFNKLKASTHENHTPKYTSAPTLLFSTYANMPAALEQWIAVNKMQKIELPALSQKMTDFSRTTFDMLSLVRKTQAFVVNEVSTKRVPLAWHQFISQSAQEVWQNNVGNEFEKTRLLWQALQAAGIPAEIVAFVPRIVWQSQIGDLNALNKFGVQVPIKGVGDMVFSAVHLNQQSLELTMPTYKMINLNNGRSIDLNVMPAEFSMNADFRLDFGQKLSADMHWKASGAMNKYMMWATQPTKATQAISHWRLEEGQKYNRLDIDAEQINVQYKAICEDEMKKEGDYYLWEMPHYQYGISAKHYLPLLSQRSENMLLPALKEAYEYNIILPKSVEWLSKPVSIHHKTDFAEMKVDIRFDKGSLLVSKMLVIYPQREEAVISSARKQQRALPMAEKVDYRVITAEQYDSFRQMMIDWFSDNANVMIFKRP